MLSYCFLKARAASAGQLSCDLGSLPAIFIVLAQLIFFGVLAVLGAD
jgi:hypothetical protein